MGGRTADRCVAATTLSGRSVVGEATAHCVDQARPVAIAIFQLVDAQISTPPKCIIALDSTQVLRAIIWMNVAQTRRRHMTTLQTISAAGCHRSSAVSSSCCSPGLSVLSYFLSPAWPRTAFNALRLILCFVGNMSVKIITPQIRDFEAKEINNFVQHVAKMSTLLCDIIFCSFCNVTNCSEMKY